MNIKSVEETICEALNNMNKSSKMAFIVTFICGLLTHGFMLLNKIPFFDDIALLFHTGGTYKNGRWFLGVIGALEYRLLGENFSTPMVKGLLAILLISAACVLLISIFKIENKMYIFIIGCIMIVYPVVTVIFGYMFMAQCFSLALFLSILAVFLTVQNKIGYVLGIICISLTLGLYQAYFAVPCVLYLLLLICHIFENKKFKENFLLALKYLSSLVLGMLLYFIINKIFLFVKKAELTSYQGINDMGQMTFADIIKRVGDAYCNFFKLVYDNFQGLNASSIAKILFGISIILTILIIVLKIIKMRMNLNTFLLGGVTAILPLAVNIIYVMCDEDVVYIHGLMVYSSVFVLLAPIILWNAYISTDEGIARNSFKSIIDWSIVLSSLIMILYYVGFDNVAYLQSSLLQSQVDSYCTTFVTTVKNAKGYADEYPIILVQDPERDEKYDFEDASMYRMTEFEQMKITSYEADMSTWISNYSLPEYLMYRTGFNAENIYDYGELLEHNEIEELDFIDEMPCYPDDGAIQVVDEKVIIKLSEF